MLNLIWKSTAQIEFIPTDYQGNIIVPDDIPMAHIYSENDLTTPLKTLTPLPTEDGSYYVSFLVDTVTDPYFVPNNKLILEFIITHNDATYIERIKATVTEAIQ